MSPPARVVWIEIDEADGRAIFGKSPPARVVWIEIATFLIISFVAVVATREGGVD